MAKTNTSCRPYEGNWNFPRVGTPSCREFFISWVQITDFMLYVLSMVSRIHTVSTKAREALAAVDELELDIFEGKLLEDDDDDLPGLLDKLVFHRQFLMEVTLVRHVENYLNYLSSLLYEIFITRPETLRSSESIELATVLSHENMGDLVRSIAQRKVESLSYRSFQDLSDYFDERFSLELFPSADVNKVIEAVETRNISVHNRCIINERFAQRTGIDAEKIGTKRKVRLSDIKSMTALLGWGTKRLDQSCRSKLKVKGVRFKISHIIATELEEAMKERKTTLQARKSAG